MRKTPNPFIANHKFPLTANGYSSVARVTGASQHSLGTHRAITQRAETHGMEMEAIERPVLSIFKSAKCQKKSNNNNKNNNSKRVIVGDAFRECNSIWCCSLVWRIGGRWVTSSTTMDIVGGVEGTIVCERQVNTPCCSPTLRKPLWENGKGGIFEVIPIDRVVNQFEPIYFDGKV